MNQRDVSVCIPTYNRYEYLREAIRSILEQTYTDYELIVSDDASTDSTRELVDSFRQDRVRYHHNARNLGPVANWNRCIELARGKYITFLADDDLMLSENLERKVHVLEEYPSVGLVHSNAIVIGSKGEIREELKPPVVTGQELVIKPGIKLIESAILNHSNPIVATSVMVRRDCFERLGHFDERIPFTSDFEMWLRIAGAYDLAYLPRPLIKYRWHEKNMTTWFLAKKQGHEQMYAAERMALERLGMENKWVRKLEQTARQKTAWRALRDADWHWEQERKEVRDLFLYALRMDPFLLFSRRGVRMAGKILLGPRGAILVSTLKSAMKKRAQY